MDPKLIKLLTVIAAVALYAGASYLPPEVQSFVREAAAALFGGVTLRRPGDLGPTTGVGDA